MSFDDSTPLRIGLRLDAMQLGARAEIEAALERAGLQVGGDEPGVVVAADPPDRSAESEPGPPVVVVLEAPDRRRAAAALDAGARGVVALEAVAGTLAPAVVAAAAGLLVLPGSAQDATQRPDLSSRERQVLGLLVMGLANAEIGRRLFLSESTVKYHLRSIYTKLGVKTRKEAASLVLDPRTGLSLGVLNVTGAERSERADGYSGPKVV